MLAAIVDLSSAKDYDLDALVAPLRGAAYRAADGGASATGFDRGDLVTTWPEQNNGVFVSVRPTAITDLAQTAAALGVPRCGVQRVSPRLGAHAALGPSSFSDYLAWAAPAFQRMLVDAAATPAGALASDPRVTGADAVAHVRARYAIGELAAAQLLLRAVGVSAVRAAQLLGGDASAELAGIPLPDPHRVHGLGDGEEPVFGRLLPLAPFRELWASATAALVDR